MTSTIGAALEAFTSGEGKSHAMARPRQLNVRLSDEAIATVLALQEYYGLSQAGVLEMVLRDRFRALGLVLKKDATELYKFAQANKDGVVPEGVDWRYISLKK